jgi:uncharacterized OsmC-like protein
MPEDTIVHSARSASTFLLGRTLNSVRDHHYIIDGNTEPKEEVTPVEMFLSAVSSCGIQWVEKFARDEGVALGQVFADIQGVRRADEPERFAYVTMAFQIAGPDQEIAQRYVEQFQARCPLYRTLAAATEIRTEVVASPA